MRAINPSVQYGIRVGLLAGAVLFWAPAGAEPAKELKAVQQQIAQKQQDIRQQQQDIKSLHRQLKADEQAISQLARRLNGTQQQLQQIREELSELNRQSQSLTRALQQQEALLAGQLAQAYRFGHHDTLKLLLNQQDPTSMARALDYYGYLNQARLAVIAETQQTQQALERNRQQTRRASERLTALVKGQEQDHSALAEKFSQRETTLGALKHSLQEDQQQLGRLQQAEKKMQQQIEAARRKLEAERQRKRAEALARARAKAKAKGESEAAAQAKEEARLASNAHKGLGKLRGQLPWPVQGRLLRQFGSPRTGQVTWKGILIGAAEGTPVKAIAAGDVVYADWLEGFGNVLVIDHGHGYLSLYGSNQALLKMAGDSIQAGDTIALVGRSGGQDSAGLYFEIRQQGQPVNPSRWLR